MSNVRGIKQQNRTFRPRGPSSAVILKCYRVRRLSTAVGDVMTGVEMTDVDGLGSE